MKYTTYILIGIIILLGFQKCTIKSTGKWKSEKNNIELYYGENWELIIPTIDFDQNTLVGIKDISDNSSFIVKITNDVSKKQISDKYYISAIREQMLNENPNNKFIDEDTINLKGIEFHRMIFFMSTKHGKITHTIYIHRNGKKMIGIQFTYPKYLTENPMKSIPSKIEDILKRMII